MQRYSVLKLYTGYGRVQAIVKRFVQVKRFKLQFGMNKMSYRFSGAVCLLSLMMSLPSFGENTFQVKKQDPLTMKLDDRTLGASYDVLGLKLGMSAAETKRILLERFHVPDNPFGKKGYHAAPGRPRYVPGRAYVEQIILHDYDNEGRGTYILCKFAEVFPGEGKGPEMLYSIQYDPGLIHDPDIQAFIDQVHKKFGKPNLEGNSLAVWGDPAHTDPIAFGIAGLPYLELVPTPTPGSGNGYSLNLWNQEIPQHMEALFISKKTITAPI